MNGFLRIFSVMLEADMWLVVQNLQAFNEFSLVKGIDTQSSKQNFTAYILQFLKSSENFWD